MTINVIDLHNFYASRLGRLSSRLIGRKIRTLWPNVTGLAVIGVGYTAPYLDKFAAKALRAGSVMPATQGVCDGLPEQNQNPCYAMKYTCLLQMNR